MKGRRCIDDDEYFHVAILQSLGLTNHLLVQDRGGCLHHGALVTLAFGSCPVDRGAEAAAPLQQPMITGQPRIRMLSP